MFKRLVKLPKNHSFFLFGARGTGKSTWLKHEFPPEKAYWIDLLDPDTENRFSVSPSLLKTVVDSLPASITHVAIDEIQKVPKMLDMVHSLIESGTRQFILTGSSARKLKYGGANLLAGRAFVNHLYPLTFLELGSAFNLEQALQFGQLPKISQIEDNEQKAHYLAAYTNTYLKEEIIGEQILKNLAPFRRFLEVAAQSNGKILNYAKIGRDVGISETIVKDYFVILEDTLIGFFLEPFIHSFRKRLSQKPKFYFFDIGVSRTLCRQVQIPLSPGSNAYGDAFEHFVILEAVRLASYFHWDWRFSYLMTKDGAEIDLVVERPGKALLCIEIKSSVKIDESYTSGLEALCRDLPNSEAVCLSNDPMPQKIGTVTALHWREGLNRYFGTEA